MLECFNAPSLTSSIIFRDETKILERIGGDNPYAKLLPIKLQLADYYSRKKSFLEKKSKATFIERILQQLIMIFTSFGSEGGLFIFIGKKMNTL